MRLYGVVKAIVGGCCRIIIDKHAAHPEDFLGIWKSRLRDLAAVNGGIAYLDAWRIEREYSLHLTQEETAFLAESSIQLSDIGEVLKYTTITKFVHKMEAYAGVKIPKEEEGLCSRAAGALRAISNLYIDYLHMRIRRGYDLNNQIYLFPRDLQAAHDLMVLETNQEKFEERNQEVRTKFPDIQRSYRKLRNKYFFEDEEYLIRPARSAEEIVAEGRFLHHCVGGDNYLHKHNTGVSTILFLRLKKQPEVPYITVEISNTRIRQWYGIRDTKPDEKNIEKWLEKYIKALKEKQEVLAVTA